MKLRRILILSLGMALCAAGGVGTALAAVSKHSSSANSAAKYDKAVYLYWDSQSTTSANLDELELDSTHAQYNYLVVSPRSSATAEGRVTVKFELKTPTAALPSGKEATTKGITVKVYSLANDATSENYVSKIDDGNLECTVTNADAIGYARFDVDPGEGVHETVQRYAIEVTYAPGGAGAGQEVAAVLEMSQTFGPKA